MVKHPRDAVSLVFGLLFSTIAVLYLVASFGHLHLSLRLVVPAVLIALGVIGLAAAVRGESARSQGGHVE